MNYFITGGTGFIGTHLTNLLNETHPECNVYNLDIVEPGTPLPTVKDYKPALKKGQKLVLHLCAVTCASLSSYLLPFTLRAKT